MDDDIRIGEKTIPLSSVINLGLKGLFGIIPKTFVYFFPSWKRKRILRKALGKPDDRNEPPSDEVIMR